MQDEEIAVTTGGIYGPQVDLSEVPHVREVEGAPCRARSCRDRGNRGSCGTAEAIRPRPLRLDHLLARSIADGSFADAHSSLALKKGERAIYSLDGVGLVESRKGPGHWQGRSQGISVRVPGTKSMRYRVGQTKGTFVSGEEKPTRIDSGFVTVTTTRAVFVGSQQTREWAWAKLVAIQDDDPSWIGIAVSNRQKVSGITLPSAEARLPLQLSLDMAVAATNGTAESYVEDLEQQRAEHVSQASQSQSASLGREGVASPPPPQMSPLPPPPPPSPSS